MNKLAVMCINCSETWEKDSVIAWESDDYSGSLCNACFLKVISVVIRRRQLKQGNDCFGKTGVSCDQYDCKYREWCLRINKLAEAEPDSGFPSALTRPEAIST
jgi:hypothetical protein